MWRLILANPYVALGLLLALAGAVVGFGTWQRHIGAAGERAAWEVTVAAQKQEAARLQIENKDRLLKVAHAFIDLHTQTEKDYADGKNKAAAAEADNLRLGGDIGRLLREQGRWLSGAYSVSPDPGTDAGGSGRAAPGQLLGALERLIAGGTGLAGEADGAALAGIACHADSVSVRAIINSGIVAPR